MCGVEVSDKWKFSAHRHQKHPVEYYMEKYGCEECQKGFETEEDVTKHFHDKVTNPHSTPQIYPSRPI